MRNNEFSGSRILLVEDEETLAVGLEFNLSDEGYHVTWVQDGRAALEKYEQEQFDLIILDIMLPYYDGFEIAEKIREDSPQMPILMLTARTSAIDRVKGLKIGADDYLTKPFHLEELLLRIKGMLKRKQWYTDSVSESPVITFGSNEINFENLTCKTHERTFSLTPLEAAFMKYLVDNKNKIVTREELLQNVWHTNPNVETRTVDNFIARLRKYFEDDPSNPKYIVSVRGKGYKFK
jgi:DNA-binding response OmpR family regulator